jgi:hypothetical protein
MLSSNNWSYPKPQSTCVIYTNTTKRTRATKPNTMPRHELDNDSVLYRLEIYCQIVFRYAFQPACMCTKNYSLPDIRASCRAQGSMRVYFHPLLHAKLSRYARTGNSGAIPPVLTSLSAVPCYMQYVVVAASLWHLDGMSLNTGEARG